MNHKHNDPKPKDEEEDGMEEIDPFDNLDDFFLED
jgi:hypothetical protein